MKAGKEAVETMSMIDNDWLPAIQDEFKKDYYRDLYGSIPKFV